MFCLRKSSKTRRSHNILLKGPFRTELGNKPLMQYFEMPQGPRLEEPQFENSQHA